MGDGWIARLRQLRECSQSNPLLDKELRVTCRRGRHYALRAGYLALLTLVTLVVYRAASLSAGPAAPGSTAASPPSLAEFIHQQAQVAQQIVFSVLVYQWAGLQFVAVLLLSACFHQEVQRRTFHSLLTSPLSDFQIVAGKLSASLWQVAVLLACALPLLSVVLAMGGVDWVQIAFGLAATGFCVLLAGAWAVFFSTWFVKPTAVVFASLGAIIGWNVLPAPGAGLLLLWLALPCLGSPRKAQHVFQRRVLVALLCPAALLPLGGLLRYGLLEHLDPALGDSLFLPSPYASVGVTILWKSRDAVALAVLCLSQLTLTMVLLWRARMAVARARAGQLFDRERRVAPRLAGVEQTVLALESWSARRSDRRTGHKGGPAGTIRRGLIALDSFHNPLVWCDAHRPVGRAGLYRWLLLLPAAALLLLGLVLVRLEAAYDPEAYNFVALGPHVLPVPDPKTLYPLIALVFLCVIFLLTAILAARSVAGPRETRTWDELLTTPLGSAAIATGKSLAIFIKTIPFVGAFLLLLLLTFPPESGTVLVGLALVLAGVLFVCALGLYVGTRASGTVQATVSVLAVLLGMWALMPLLLHDLLGPMGQPPALMHAEQWFNPPLQFYLFAQSADPSPLAPPPPPRAAQVLLSVSCIVGLSLVLAALACRRFRRCA